MSIIKTESRNIAHYARKIVGEKLIMDRRQWELMMSHKANPDVQELGNELLGAYKGIMINVTAVDLFDVNASTISTNLISQTEQQTRIINACSRYLLTELTQVEYTTLCNHLASVIVYWSFGASGIGQVEEADMIEESEQIEGMLNSNAAYVTLLLMTDLHHLTYVASAEQCLEILSST